MSLIGAIEFDLMHGLTANLKMRTDVWETPGIDGYGIQQLASGDAAFQLVTVFFANDAAGADQHIVACEALQGSITTLTDIWDDEFTGIFVEKVDTTNAKRGVIYLGNADAVRVSISWVMRSTAVQ